MRDDISGADWELCLAELDGLDTLDAAGEPDEAWQRLYERLGQQRGRSGSLGTAQVTLCLDLLILCHLMRTPCAAQMLFMQGFQRYTEATITMGRFWEL